MNGLNGSGKKQVDWQRSGIFRHLVNRLQEKIQEELDDPNGRITEAELRQYQKEVYGI